MRCSLRPTTSTPMAPTRRPHAHAGAGPDVNAVAANTTRLGADITRMGAAGGATRMGAADGASRLGAAGGASRTGAADGASRLGAADGASRMGAADGASRLGAADGASRMGAAICADGILKTILAKQSRQLSNRGVRSHQLIKGGLTQHGARSSWMISDTLFRRCPWVVRLGDDW